MELINEDKLYRSPGDSNLTSEQKKLILKIGDFLFKSGAGHATVEGMVEIALIVYGEQVPLDKAFEEYVKGGIYRTMAAGLTVNIEEKYKYLKMCIQEAWKSIKHANEEAKKRLKALHTIAIYAAKILKACFKLKREDKSNNKHETNDICNESVEEIVFGVILETDIIYYSEKIKELK